MDEARLSRFVGKKTRCFFPPVCAEREAEVAVVFGKPSIFRKTLSMVLIISPGYVVPQWLRQTRISSFSPSRPYAWGSSLGSKLMWLGWSGFFLYFTAFFEGVSVREKRSGACVCVSVCLSVLPTFRSMQRGAVAGKRHSDELSFHFCCRNMSDQYVFSAVSCVQCASQISKTVRYFPNPSSLVLFYGRLLTGHASMPITTP